MTNREPKETIQLSVLDSALYGAARAFEYLGPRGQAMLEKIGEGIVDYCLKERYLKPSDNWEELTTELTAFFVENGYLRGREVVREGEIITEAIRGYQYLSLKKKLRDKGSVLYSCPWCVAEDAITRTMGVSGPRLRAISEETLSDGTYVRKHEIAGGSESKRDVLSIPLDLSFIKAEALPADSVGLPVFEAVEYGLVRGYNYLGAQAQLLLDNLGIGIIEFLEEEFQLNLPHEPEKSAKSLASFYVSGGLADSIEVDISSSSASVEFTNYRYAAVLRALLDEGITLASCPLTLTIRAVLRNAGLAVKEMKWKIGDRRDVTLALPIINVAGQQFDEDRVSSMMDAV